MGLKWTSIDMLYHFVGRVRLYGPCLTRAFVKLSGTKQAGDHTEENFPGFTWDAIAHLSFATSSGTQVFDIQVIITNSSRRFPNLKPL
ncbi:hypothetical protein M408DRAFT_237698 [Serendipita vermifera MAFF 305830]|uniref:Uncharacterized protein n=1 Tax=Serendipita vermifera MAFF 305830 TaxID=933852 RepID=A0A0C2X0B9_SERVB|nr:hypothetical protein M408DRAFT_237698 [Serendipita vermifera MAFF 305830]